MSWCKVQVGYVLIISHTASSVETKCCLRSRQIMCEIRKRRNSRICGLQTWYNRVWNFPAGYELKKQSTAMPWNEEIPHNRPKFVKNRREAKCRLITPSSEFGEPVRRAKPPRSNANAMSFPKTPAPFGGRGYKRERETKNKK